MTEPKDSFGRLFVDIFVTIVLVFSAIGVAGFAAESLAPQIGGIYVVCLLVALVPAALWLRRCRVNLFVNTAQVAAFAFSCVVVSFVTGFPQPNPWMLPGWAVMAIVIGTFRLSELLFERVPILRSPAEEQGTDE
jgi:hypothetical protein